MGKLNKMKHLLLITLLSVLFFSTIAQERKYYIILNDKDAQVILDYFKKTIAIVDNSNIGVQDYKYITSGAQSIQNEFVRQLKPQVDSMAKADSALKATPVKKKK